MSLSKTGTKLKWTHRGVGEIFDEYREGVVRGLNLRLESHQRNSDAAPDWGPHFALSCYNVSASLAKMRGVIRGRITDTSVADKGVASICKEIRVHRPRDVVWDAIRDVGAIHTRLVPGFVVECRLEGDSRYLTFANGMTIREIIVDVDDQNYRHAWSARGAPFTHHNASIQVFLEGDTSCRLVWIADVLPNEVAGAVAEMIQQGLDTMKVTLEDH